MSQANEPPKTVLQKLLDGVETVGNKVPHPAVIFLALIGVVVLLSHVFYVMGTSVSYQRINPQTHDIEDLTATVNSLLTADGIRFLLTSTVRNFLNFGPVGVILVANLYFAIVSSLVLCVVCTVITKKFVEPRLGAYHGEVPGGTGEGVSGSEEESRGLAYALYALLGVVVVLSLLTLPPGAPLRHPATGAIVGSSPFMDSLIVLIMLVFLATGLAYGIGAQAITSSVDAINAITTSFASLSDLLLLFLVISQFIAYFNYSNMATVAAVKMADFLKSANFGTLPLLLGFIAVVGIVGMIIVGVIPKWAIFAPIFVPLFMKLNVAPEVVLAAYRVADSPPNVITPLMPYLGLIVVFVQRYQQEAGVGTVVAMMLPYYVGVFAVWTLLLVAWFLLGLPLGPR
jgi:aminobenzoyl-glutamate transport protein